MPVNMVIKFSEQLIKATAINYHTNNEMISEERHCAYNDRWADKQADRQTDRHVMSVQLEICIEQ